MNISVDNLWDKVKETHPIALNEWVRCFQGDENKAKEEISNTLMYGATWTDRSINFLLRLISDDMNGYRLHGDSEPRPRVQLALTFVEQMTEFDPMPVKLINFFEETLSVHALQAEMPKRGNRLIHEAARSGRCAILQRLDLLTVENVNYLNNIGETALHLAAECEHPKDVKILLRAGAKFTVCVML